MNEKIRFQSNVATDLNNLLTPYEAISITTSNKVRDSIKKTLDLIALFPQMYVIAFDDIRVVKIDDYPILVQYRIVDRIPVIASIVFAGSPFPS